MTDRELLIAYQQHRSPEHFAQLVTTHINLVYSVARRHTKDPHLAEDISQEVFLTLARKAPAIRPDIPLAGWLFTTTRLLSLQALRAASRRSRHESEAAMSHEPPPQSDPTWSLIAEDIDKAVADLPATDRDAILLRYFNGQSTNEIAATLAISEDAAKKRVQRALETLRELLVLRGLGTRGAEAAITPATLATALAAHAVHVAPSALASSITATLTTKAAATAATKGTLMAAAKLKTALIATAAVVAITASATTAVYLSKHNTAALTTPSELTTPANTDGLPQPPTDTNRATNDFLSAYALPPNRVIAVLPNVAPAFRLAMYQKSSPGQNRRSGQPLGSMVIQWENGQPSVWGMSGGSGFPLEVFFSDIIDVYSPEIISPFPIPNLTGDLVFRANATPTEYLADLQTILSAQYQHPVTCSFRIQAMDVVVFSGVYQLNPPPDAPSDGNSPSSIFFYLHTIDPSRNGGGGSGNARRFAGAISEHIGKPVIIEAANFPKRLFYRNNGDLPGSLSTPDDINLFLRHISDQTGLTVTHETRLIRCLVIADAASHPVDQSQAAASWKGWGVGAYPAVSPFQAVRWNGDTPEVQVNNTWYQLLALNELPAGQIVASAKAADREWQRRFEEDLPALLAYMGHEPGATVALQLKNLQTQKIETLTDVPMTQDNRDAIYQARHAAAVPQ